MNDQQEDFDLHHNYSRIWFSLFFTGLSGNRLILQCKEQKEFLLRHFLVFSHEIWLSLKNHSIETFKEIMLSNLGNNHSITSTDFCQ